jgi:RND family efflux transporter MFP subunit
VKTRRKSTYWGLIVVLMAALLVGGCGQTEEAVKETEISVNTAQATERNIAKSVRYAGTVRGQNEVYLIAKVPARVTGIHVNPGDKVSQGQKLITLDSSDYQAAVAQAQAGVKAATLQLENARLGLERTEKLHAAGAASQLQLEQAQSAYDGALVGVETANAGLAMASQQIGYCNLTSPINGVVGSINLSLGDTANGKNIKQV